MSYGGSFSTHPLTVNSQVKQALGINKLAPNTVVTIRNRASVLLMDHSEDAGGISISGQWDDMK